ncbi:PAS domain-containing protein [Sungkyunkwania multivorans]|uniref:histidine kinase n=1 Tax=Sungkyunkwania multivorans TaxID=1173618 RepID=A0ABW3CUJ8_9FLAO
MPQEILQKLSQQVDGFFYQFQYSEETNLKKFIFVSEGSQNVYEATPTELTASPDLIFERVYRKDKSLVYAAISTSLSKLQSWELDFRAILPEKGLRWLKGNGKPEKQTDGSVIWYGYINDITERKHTESALLENKQRLEFALQGSEEGVWDWNLKTNHVFYSEQSIKILGLENASLLNKAEEWDERVHPEDRASYFEDIQRHFAGETDFYVNEHRVLCDDGAYKWILDRGKVIARDKQGNPMRVIGTHADITWKKEKELALENTLDIVGQQNGRLLNFAHIVSHNLKNHAGNFKMLLDLLEETDSHSEKEEITSYLKTTSDSLTETIEHLTEIVSIQTNARGQKESLQLKTFVKGALNTLSGEIAHRQATIVDEVDDEAFVNYLPAYLDSILLNLLSNALKYSDTSRKPVINIRTSLDQEKVSLQIRDNGIGIDLEKYGDRLFGMYQTFHGNENAVGIGLFITKNQVEAMGGNIELESTPNRGTTFTIHF